MAIEQIEQIGDIILINGDSFEICPAAAYEWDSVVTDPPYGMNWTSVTDAWNGLAGDKDTEAMLWACEIPVIHSRYVWMRWDNLCDLYDKPRSLITWLKPNHTIGDLAHEHGRMTEVCAFWPGPDHSWPGNRPTDVLAGKMSGNKNHPTEKPLSIMRSVVRWTAGTILDPFMGSGTTLVAAAQEGRKAIGIEIDPQHFETACERVHSACEQSQWDF